MDGDWGPGTGTWIDVFKLADGEEEGQWADGGHHIRS